MIHIPQRFPFFKPLLVLLAVYTAVWMALEGNFGRVLVMGVGWTAVLCLHLIQKFRGGRVLGRWRLVVETAVGGALFAFISIALTLLFMVLKTGIHAHGAEFSPYEINQLIQKLPIALLAGTLAGTGLGLITICNEQ